MPDAPLIAVVDDDMSIRNATQDLLKAAGFSAVTFSNAASFLDSPSRIEAYLNAALDEGDPQAFAQALGTVARAKGMAQVAAQSRLGRESLYKALSAAGNPAFASVVKVASALGFDLRFKRRTLRTSPAKRELRR